MRGILAWVGICLGASVLRANDHGPFRPPAPPLDGRQARVYAIQLAHVVHKVADAYIRPISEADLAVAGLKGLYEAAQVPFPRDLPAEVRQAFAEADPANQAALDLFLRARLELGDIEALRGTKAIRASLEGIVGVLDPFCAVLNGSDLHRNAGERGESPFGLELLSNAPAGPWVVKSVALGGAAQKAGIRPGDVITAAQPAPPDFTEARQARLTLTRPGTPTPRTLTLMARPFQAETVLGVTRRDDNSWDYFIDPERKIAQVRIASLDAGTDEELTEVLLALREAGVRGLILDLRWCPGGMLEPSRVVADLFLGDYGLPFFMFPTPANLAAQADLCLDTHYRNATVRYRDGRLDSRSKHAEKAFPFLPVVVLVNSATSGGAELVAAVLQDNLRARIAGQRTRGKGSVQWLFDLEHDPGMPLPGLPPLPIADTGMKVTGGLLLRPGGKNLNRFPDSKPADDWGVRPDPGLEFPISPALDRRLQAWWQLQNLRPGGSSEGLPLDDPVADPQRQAALRILLEALEGPDQRAGSRHRTNPGKRTRPAGLLRSPSARPS